MNSDSKWLIAFVVLVVGVAFLLYFAITSHYKLEQHYLNKDCAKRTILGSTGTHWVCPPFTTQE